MTRGTDHEESVERPGEVRSEGGYMLIELLVGIMLFLGVMAAAVPVVISSVRAEPRISERANMIQQARTTVERLTREIRLGYAVDVAQPEQLAFRTYTRKSVCGGDAILPAGAPATPCRVTYSCSGGTCTRIEQSDVGGSASTAQIVNGLLSNQVFSYRPSAQRPDYVQIRLVMPAENGNDAITLDAGANLRNVTRSG